MVEQVPYVARLQQIFVYSFAPSEVYFNARWYYRVGDVHEYAKMSGAKGDVEYEGYTPHLPSRTEWALPRMLPRRLRSACRGLPLRARLLTVSGALPGAEQRGARGAAKGALLLAAYG